VEDFAKTSKYFKSETGAVDITKVMAEVTIYTASRTLQGREVREKLNATFADYYHDLDMGFSPINFMLPWAPLPHNRKRDAAREAMARTYLDIIEERRANGAEHDEKDMIWNLTGSTYKDGKTIPDREVCHMMIALLMAGQHSSSATAAWITLRLASRPDIQEELYQEQVGVFGKELRPITYEDLDKLPLHHQVVKETLRLHGPIHSIMRAVKSPMPVDGTNYVVPVGHTLMAAPGVSGKSAEYFPNPDVWDIHRWDNEAPAAKEENDDLIDYGYGLVSKGTGSPYLPFGAGRHRCIGEKFAYVQLATITATMLREFTFKLPDGQTKVPETDYSVSPPTRSL
jgi:sterol 14alpha-demethylase